MKHRGQHLRATLVSVKASLLAVALVLTLAGCTATRTPEPTSRIPEAFADYDASELDFFFGGAWVYTDSVSKDCGTLGSQWCAHLEVADNSGCDQGFAVVVQFKDEYGDVVDEARGRVLGVTAERVTRMEVISDTTARVMSIYVKTAQCI